MLAHRPRCWADIEPTLVEPLVLTKSQAREASDSLHITDPVCVFTHFISEPGPVSTVFDPHHGCHLPLTAYRVELW